VKDFVQRRWYDFRLGHSTYLVFLLSFSNFVLIFHRLLLEKIGVEMRLWLFGALFLCLYVPVAVLVGWWHRKHQIRVDSVATGLENPLFMSLLHDVEEIKQMLIEKESKREEVT